MWVTVGTLNQHLVMLLLDCTCSIPVLIYIFVFIDKLCKRELEGQYLPILDGHTSTCFKITSHIYNELCETEYNPYSTLI